MGLLSFFKRSSSAVPAVAESADDVRRIRTRARQRLIGAVVLIGAGVLGFPLLFETQPRPIAVDIPIEIMRKDQAPPLVMPPARAKPAASSASQPAAKETVVAEPGAQAGRDAGPMATPGVADASAAASTPSKVEKASTTPATRAPVARAPAATPQPRARAESKAAAEPSKKEETAPAGGRFAVQVGAFSDAVAAREMRQRVEKLGLKTYTQVVETSSGKTIRVRVGPFASRDEAEKAAGKIRSAGLSTALFPV